MGLLVGVGHRARTGKDTIGDYLEDHRNWHRTCFAASLKEAVKIIYGWTNEHVYGSLKEEVDPFWKTTPREVLQKFGTEACRNNLRDDIWVKSLEKRIKSAPDANWVITDVRFPNEVAAIKSWGGFVVRVDKEDPHKISTKGHVSEHALDGYLFWDAILKNDRDYNTLFEKVDELVERLSLMKVSSISRGEK